LEVWSVLETIKRPHFFGKLIRVIAAVLLLSTIGFLWFAKTSASFSYEDLASALAPEFVGAALTFVVFYLFIDFFEDISDEGTSDSDELREISHRIDEIAERTEEIISKCK